MSAQGSWEGGERRSSTGKTVLIIALIGCGGLVVLALACGGIGYWYYQKSQKDMPAAQAAAEAFLDALKAHKIDAAYDQTSSAYQKTMPKDQFANYLKAFPALTDWTSRSVQLGFAVPVKDSGMANVIMQLQSKQGPKMCTIMLMKEGNDWKVQQITVQ